MNIIAINEHKRYRNTLATQLIRGIREAVGRCENCGSAENLTVHHTRKRCHNGTDYGDNLVVLCEECHQGLHFIEDLK